MSERKNKNDQIERIQNQYSFHEIDAFFPKVEKPPRKLLKPKNSTKPKPRRIVGSIQAHLKQEYSGSYKDIFTSHRAGEAGSPSANIREAILKRDQEKIKEDYERLRLQKVQKSLKSDWLIGKISIGQYEKFLDKNAAKIVNARPYKHYLDFCKSKEKEPMSFKAWAKEIIKNTPF